MTSKKKRTLRERRSHQKKRRNVVGKHSGSIITFLIWSVDVIGPEDYFQGIFGVLAFALAEYIATYSCLPATHL